MPDGCPNVGKSILLGNYPKEILATSVKYWRIEEHYRDKFMFDKYFVLKNNNTGKNDYVVDIYDSSNWTEVTEKFREK